MSVAQPADLLSQDGFDSGSQILAHRVFLASLACLTIMFSAFGSLFGRIPGTMRAAIDQGCALLRRPPAYFFLLLLPGFLVWYTGVGQDQYYLGVAGFALLLYLAHRLQKSAWATLLAVAALAGYIGLLLIPGFFAPYELGGALMASLQHYYALFELSAMLTADAATSANMLSFYGLLPGSLLAYIQRGTGPFEFGDYILAVQYAQVAFILITFAAMTLYKPRRLVVILLCMALWVPWISNSGHGIIAPTSSGLRFLGFPIAVLAVLLAGKIQQRAWSAAVVGLGAGIALLNSFETGVCAIIGGVAFCCVSERAGRMLRVAMRLFWLFCGIALAAWAYAVLFRLGFGAWPQISMESVRAVFSVFVHGYSGLPFRIDSLAVLLFVFPALLLARLTLVWLRRGLSQNMRFKFFLCVIILVWFAYYVNRPHHWNLWSNSLLFSFLLVDVFDTLKGWRPRLSGARSLLTVRVPVAAFLLVFIVGPHLVNDGLSEAKNVVRRARADSLQANAQPDREVFSGIWVKSACAEGLRDKVAFVRSQPQDVRIFYASPYFFLVQLHTLRFFPLPSQDVFYQTFSREHLLETARKIEASKRDIVLLDALPPSQSNARWEEFERTLGDALQDSFRPVGEEEGWHVLKHIKS